MCLSSTTPASPAKYAEVFEEAWNDEVEAGGVHRRRRSPAETVLRRRTRLRRRARSRSRRTRRRSPTRSPRRRSPTAYRRGGADGDAIGSVLFAVMELGAGTGPRLHRRSNNLHANQQIFSYGISDNPGGISLYAPGQKTGVLVTGKPVRTQLPPPFNQVPGVGAGHQIHHKFVVCGFNGAGSRRLLRLVEPRARRRAGERRQPARDPRSRTSRPRSRSRRSRSSTTSSSSTARPRGRRRRRSLPPRRSSRPANRAGWFLSTSDGWTKPYFDDNDLHSLDRRLFAELAS